MPLSNRLLSPPLQNNQTFITIYAGFDSSCFFGDELDFLLEVLVHVHSVFSSAAFPGQGIEQSAGLGAMIAPFAAGAMMLPQ